MIKRFKLVVSRSLIVGWYACTCLFLWVGQLDAQTVRDPTLPPPVQSALAGSAKKSSTAVLDTGPLTIIVRDGRRYVVLGTRLYAQGQKFGRLRIERISETEVWFLENGVVRKLSRFPDVQRRTVGPAKRTLNCATGAQESSGSASCADLRP